MALEGGLYLCDNPDIGRNLQNQQQMEGTNYMTTGDFLLWENRKDDGCHHRKGLSATALGFGIGGLAIALAGLWGVNQASKSRSETAKALSDGNTKAIDLVAQHLAAEKSRNDSINLDVTQSLRSLSSAQGTGTANALSTAEALAYAQAVNNNSGVNSAIGGCNFLRVARYSAPSPCPCDTCNG